MREELLVGYAQECGVYSVTVAAELELNCFSASLVAVIYFPATAVELLALARWARRWLLFFTQSQTGPCHSDSLKVQTGPCFIMRYLFYDRRLSGLAALDRVVVCRGRSIRNAL